MIKSSFCKENNVLGIEIIGAFNFDASSEFKASYIGISCQAYEIDFEQTSSMDSGALSLLINMRRTVGG